MYEQIDKHKESKSKSAPSVVSKKNDLQKRTMFADNRPAAIAQKKIMELPARSTQSFTVQLRPLNIVERENLAEAKEQFEKFKNRKSVLTNALVNRGGYGNLLGYFQDAGRDEATEEIRNLDNQFNEMTELSRRAGSNHKACREFISRVNFFSRSGGMNRFDKIFKNIEKGLLSKQRNNTNQFTEMDEVYFRKYMADAKSPVTVLRGDGRDVTPQSFDTLSFTNVPAGGTSDITFAGVVEHTHTNTLKNGMVSCTTDFATALHFATSEHEYGVVWEFMLDKYIHVANLLKARNFKNRFPQQFEVLYPGAIPSSKIVSATLYRKNVAIKKRTS